MTLEDRLNELETMIAALRRDMQSPRKFKVGDDVFIPGQVVEVDNGDTNLPYKVKFGEGEDYDSQWFSELLLSKHLPKAP